MRKLFILLLLSNAYLANAQVEMRADSAIIKSKLRIKNHSEGLGKVLTSDANGNATWQNPSGGGGLWTQTLGFIENNNSNGFWSRYASPLPIGANNTTYPPTSPTSGNGTRMAWIPSRSAFQGGTFNLADGSVRFVSENIGLFSFCYGLNSESRSRGGIAMGEGAIADGTSNTIAFGEDVQVAGVRNFGGGFSNQISDGSSNTVLFGENSNAVAGQYNHGLGWGLEMNGFGTSTLGTFNVLPFLESPAQSNTAWVAADPLLIVGNGQSNLARSNALVIQKNGIVNIGITSSALTTYKLRVGGGISANSTIQAVNLRATNLQGAGIRDVCTDASGNLIECVSSFSVSAMGFHPQTTSTTAAAGFQRDILNGFVSFANNTKQTEAKMFAPVELPNGFPVKQMTFHFKQNSGGSMTVKFMVIPKLNAGPATNPISISSFSGSNVLENSDSPGSTLIIDNSANYYFLVLEAGSVWQGTEMALRGVMFYSESQK